jgi:ribosomal protein L40E
MRPSMLPMPSHQCRFCGHINPDGAKYCNECGTQLNLRPCRLCDAINDVAADHCHKCGAALPEQPAPALAPVAAAAALSSAVAPLREGESEPTSSAGDAVAIAGDADAAVGSDAHPAEPPEDRRPDVETHPASRWAWVAATLAAVGVAAYLAYSPDRADDAAGSSQATPGGPPRNDAAGSATSASAALPKAMPTATTSSGAPEPVPVDIGASRDPTFAQPGVEAPAAGVSSPGSGAAALAPGASPGAQPLSQPSASAGATQAGKAKAKPKAKPKPKPKAKPKSQTAK